jgi:hypothetical protein
VPTARFNRVLWKGHMGATPYPVFKRAVATGAIAGKIVADDD